MKKLFSIKDTKIAFMTPFQHHNEATAIREFATVVNLPEKNAANENIEDKELWLLGEFDEETGIITSNVRFLCKAIDLVRKTEEKKHEPTNNVCNTFQTTDD